MFFFFLDNSANSSLRIKVVPVLYRSVNVVVEIFSWIEQEHSRCACDVSNLVTRGRSLWMGSYR